MFAKVHSLPQPLVSVQYLKENLQSVKVIDASWYMPSQNRNPDKEYSKEHIPEAVRFDVDAISDKSIDLPHMIPPVEQFEQAVSEMGISNDDKIVVYDGMGLFSAPRVYWTFKYFGHKDIAVLDGGFPLWKKENGWISDAPPTIIPGKYKATPQPDIIKDFQYILQNIQNLKQGGKGAQVLDARSNARWTGEAAEPRPIPSGHMPFSKSLPFNELINAETGQLKTDQELAEIFDKLDVDIHKNIVCSCGSGVTASIIYFALTKLGAKNISLYDGSWSEYASDPTKVEIVNGNK